MFTTLPTPGFDWSALLWFGTVLDDGEAASSARWLEAAGPAAAVAYHALYEQHDERLRGLPGADVWVAAIEAVPEERRHLEVHRGDLTAINDTDRLTINGELAVGLTQRRRRPGAVDDAATAEGGTTEIAFQPAGPDLRRELEAFVAAVR